MRRAISACRAWALLAPALLISPSDAGAQYFLGGGYGGFGYGPWADMGLTLYDQQMIKSQTYMLNANRYNMMSAGINMMDQRANLMQQEALSVAMRNQRAAHQMMQERYNLYTKQKKAQADAIREIVGVPIENLVSPQGQVVWPDYAPSGGAHEARRASADQAIARAYAQYQEKGRADIPLVVEAKRELHAYGEPALKLLGARSNPRPRAEMVQFLNVLEMAIEGMAEPKKG